MIVFKVVTDKIKLRKGAYYMFINPEQMVMKRLKILTALFMSILIIC